MLFLLGNQDMVGYGPDGKLLSHQTLDPHVPREYESILPVWLFMNSIVSMHLRIMVRPLNDVCTS